MTRDRAIAACALLTIVASSFVARGGGLDDEAVRAHLHKTRDARAGGGALTPAVACVNGRAGIYPCRGVDLLSHVPLSSFQGRPGFLGSVNDIWGWTDPDTGDEYALVGKANGTAFFRITDPTAPVYLGDIPNASAPLNWHDIKVFDDRAFIVSESPAHMVKVFDLTRLRQATSPQTWVEDVRYPLNIGAHNIAINEETGFAYVVGGSIGLLVRDACSGLHMLDIRGAIPVPAGCYLGDGYIHDTQCVVYRGPDEDHTGREICVNSSEDMISVVDVTDKQFPVRISSTGYPDIGYTHQGWLTEDHRYFVLGDELDELDFENNTRTMIFDMTDLDAPTLIGQHIASTPSIDHNMYIRDGLIYQSNYTAGLRILDTTGIAQGVLNEVAYFDLYPANDAPSFNGSWSNYPFFPSGTIAATSIGEGLFLLRRSG